MRLIIAGPREFKGSIADIQRAYDESPYDEITTVVSGKAPGVDKLGEDWAEVHGIKVDPYPANWDMLGSSAGPIRNGQMAENADALLALWDGRSLGTRNMISQAAQKGLPVFVWPVRGA